MTGDCIEAHRRIVAVGRDLFDQLAELWIEFSRPPIGHSIKLDRYIGRLRGYRCLLLEVTATGIQGGLVERTEFGIEAHMTSDDVRGVGSDV